MKNGRKSTIIKGMTTQELAAQEGVAWITLRKWCKNNNVKRKLGAQGIMEYDLSEKDIEKFRDRNKKRGPKPAKKPKK